MNDDKYFPVGVRLCSPTNSTLFTECCDCAVTDTDSRCPHCKRLVIGHDESPSERRKLRWEHAYGPIRRRRKGYFA